MTAKVSGSRSCSVYALARVAPHLAASVASGTSTAMEGCIVCSLVSAGVLGSGGWSCLLAHTYQQQLDANQQMGSDAALTIGLGNGTRLFHLA